MKLEDVTILKQRQETTRPLPACLRISDGRWLGADAWIIRPFSCKPACSAWPVTPQNAINLGCSANRCRSLLVVYWQVKALDAFQGHEPGSEVTGGRAIVRASQK